MENKIAAAVIDHRGYLNPESIQEVRNTPIPWGGRTSSGYGKNMPTERLIKIENRWHRVLVTCHGNAGTAFVRYKNADVPLYDTTF